ncbi:hypothetical protein M9H77_30256 [Catharanthus roseus]|uniref:Uncharacterized protein n=1 Tax=Catharanthus roseus TaxID=4058 RepID=A0ACB9ZYT0_CATRO|nr:hypothetical protein M9H77_30256 [Catharanthus roseus]
MLKAIETPLVKGNDRRPVLSSCADGGMCLKPTACCSLTKEQNKMVLDCCLVELRLFYWDLCAPKISESYMHELEESIPILICKLERIFPSGFFDVMEHLMIHLSNEAREAAIFFSYYFEESVPTLHKRVRRTDDVRNPLHQSEVLSICNQQERKFGEMKKRFLDDGE